VLLRLLVAANVHTHARVGLLEPLEQQRVELALVKEVAALFLLQLQRRRGQLGIGLAFHEFRLRQVVFFVERTCFLELAPGQVLLPGHNFCLNERALSLRRQVGRQLGEFRGLAQQLLIYEGLPFGERLVRVDAFV